MAYSGSQVTRLGLAGVPRGLYGSFAGRDEAIAEPVYGFGARGRIGSASGTDTHARIGSETATDKHTRIGSGSA